MFSTIKSKIIALTVSTLVFLFLLMLGVSLLNYKSNERLLIDGNKYHIDGFTQHINSEISKLEDNVLALTSLAEFYLKSDMPESILKEMVIHEFQNYADTLGGGLFFKPYLFNTDKRLFSVYAYHDAQKRVVLDPSFSSDEYDYPMQRWYLEILPRLSLEKKLVWSSPYLENQGTESLMTTLGAPVYHQGKLFAIATVDWKIQSIVEMISKMKPTAHSFVLFADKTNDFVISTTDDTMNQWNSLGLSLKVIPWYHENLEHQESFVYQNKTYIPYVKNLRNGMILIINIPKDELFASTINYIRLVSVLLFVFSFLISWGIYFILQKYINRPVEQLIRMVNKIGQGNLDAKIELNKPYEFACLAKTFNQMTQDLKQNLHHLHEMTKTQEKIAAELSIAHQIQSDALPHRFPVHPSFEISASMKTAKDVGGDFYDFFFVDKTHFAFVMADVSGKGVTAALFMMAAKTMIRNILTSGHTLKQVAQKVNQGLCDNNSRGMFVTAFIGILNLENGEIQYLNAGHCPPLIKTAKGYDYMTPVSNLVLGVLPEFDFKISKIRLKKNERIFLYTDGVTEAQNTRQKLYGTERLKDALNHSVGSLNETLQNVHVTLQNFVKNAEQSDDITMMEVMYCGQPNKAQAFLAEVPQWPQVLNFIKKEIKGPDTLLQNIELISEEIFTNISKYAYEDSGTMRLTIKENPQHIQLEFSDFGRPYNPLTQLSPDIKAQAKDRKIGGLGIYMVKQLSQKMTYERREGQNILTIQIKKEK